MNRSVLWAAALALPLGIAGQLRAQSPNVSATPGTPMSTNSMARGATTTSAAGMAPLAAADKTFAMKAVQGGLAEVQEGQLAQQQGNSQGVKQYGQQMVTDHTKANQQLMQIASSKGITLPTMPDAKQQKEATKLQGLSGGKFDRAYIKAQVNGHQDQAQIFQNEINNGRDPDLKNFAQQTLPIVQNHLQMAQGLK